MKEITKKYCVVCGKEWGLAMTSCCSDNSLITAIHKKNDVAYYSDNHERLTPDDIQKLKSEIVISEEYKTKQAAWTDKSQSDFKWSDIQENELEKKDNSGISLIVGGLIQILIGGALTVYSIMNPSSGGYYVLWWGLILSGFITFIKGLIKH
ncbi:hypothetical protein JXJ21_08325 [candidate division KSB1 bacterium]|nr:hypothetical protein [candidate division KSB1 bacterium]